MAEEKTIDPNIVYISFTGADSGIVEKFVGILKANDIPVRASIEKGVVKKISEFEREIGESRITVIFYSRPYFESYHCMNEYALIRKNKDPKDVYTVRCNSFKFDSQIVADLKKHWHGEKGLYEEEGGDIANMREDLKAAYDNSFYVNKANDYSIHNLEKFFRDDNYYTPDNWDTLVNLLKSPSIPVEAQRISVSAAAAPSLPKMSIREGIVPREKEVEDLKKLLDENRLVNMIGLGGCGKSTISEYFWQKYHPDYHIVTSVVVSVDYYKDFVEKFREAVGVPYKFNDDFKQEAVKTPNYKKTYDAIIERLESDQYKGSDGKPNLIVIDVNETAEYEPVRNELAKFRSSLLAWKILVVSRVKMCPGITLYEPLNVTNVDDEVLEKIFFHYLEKGRHDYYKEELKEHFSQLFTFLFRLPLLVEHLAYYLSNSIIDKTYQKILNDLKIDQDVFNKRFAGRNAKIKDDDKYEIIGEYLVTLIVFSKLDNLTQTRTLLKDIARHFAILPTGFYGLDFIERFVCVSDSSYSIEEGLGFLVEKCIITPKEDKKTFQMHGLVAESCRKQIYTLDENKAFRNFDGFKHRVDSFDKIYDSDKQQDKDYRAAIADSFTNIIPNTVEEDNYVLRKAYQYANRDIYEHILKVKLLRLQNVDGSLFVHLNTEDFVKKSADQLYYSWLQQQPDKRLVPKRTDRDGNVFISIEGVEIKMVKVYGGTFKMGAQNTNKKGDNYDDEAYDRESPVHNVELSDFYIGETPVTQGLWKAVMGRDNNPSSFDKGNDYPVESVSWYDCLNFIIELNKKTGLKFRFPTEAQWEFAARGGNKHSPYKYSGGKNIEDVAVYWGNSKNDSDDHCSSPVKSKAPNELGIYDMSGNVYEWCQDWYDDYTSGNVDNPTGPSSGSSRVLRGGSLDSYAKYCRVSYRDYVSPVRRDRSIGLRLALPCSPFPS